MTAAVGAGRMVRDRLVDWGYAAGWTLVRALPERVAAALFTRVGDLAFRRQGPGIRRLRGNLRRVVGPELPEAELDQLTRRAVRSYARYWLETFRLPVMDRDRVAARADRNTHGVEHLDRASAEGRGVILVLPHMGNYDVAGVWLIARDGPFTTVAERLRPESLFDRFMAYRQKLGMEVLPLTGGSRTPADVLVHRLRAGGTVCLVGDRDLTESGIEVTFFGEPAKMPAGPAYLAARTGASLLPVGLWFEAGGWGQRIHPPVPVPTSGTLRERVASATQRVADAFAEEIADHPADWHMLQRLWLTDLPGAGQGSTRFLASCTSDSDGVGHADMRVGLVCPYSWDIPGGVQAHVRDLAEALIRMGHQVSVLTPADGDEDRETPLQPYVVPAGRTVPIPYNGSVARLQFGPVSATRVRRWLRDGRFDVCTSTSRWRRACHCSPACWPGVRSWRRSTRPIPGPGPCRQHTGCCNRSWRRSGAGSRSPRPPARYRSSTWAGTPWRSPTGWTWRVSPPRGHCPVTHGGAARSASSGAMTNHARV